MATTYLYHGRTVRTVATTLGDSDPRATVWVCYTDEPDVQLHVAPTELTPICSTCKEARPMAKHQLCGACFLNEEDALIALGF